MKRYQKILVVLTGLLILGGSVRGKSNSETIDLVKLARELCRKEPSKEKFWNPLGTLEKREYNDQLSYTPKDERFSRIVVHLSREGTGEIESVDFFLKAKITIKNLEASFGKSKPMVIGPSNPGHRSVAFGDVKMQKAPYRVAVFGKMEGYDLTPATPLIEISFRRDKL